MVTVGARSALFLPYRDLGLIVVDEAHEPSFKQEEGVQYHARDVAVMRAVAGAIAFDRLVRLLRLLGHASFSILDAMQVSEDPGPPGPPITRE